jgi:hypothetical protein
MRPAKGDVSLILLFQILSSCNLVMEDNGEISFTWFFPGLPKRFKVTRLVQEDSGDILLILL